MSKTIMLSDEIYNALTRLKKPGESYTELIARYIGRGTAKKKSLLECAGLWGHLSKEDTDAMENAIKEGRKNWRKIEW